MILAGGDGKRLLPLTRKITGDDRPKQFFSVLDGGTLLGQTRDRVRRMVSPRRTLVVVTRTHERFYADQVTSLHSLSVLVQPCNRGTTPSPESIRNRFNSYGTSIQIDPTLFGTGRNRPA